MQTTAASLGLPCETFRAKGSADTGCTDSPPVGIQVTHIPCCVIAYKEGAVLSIHVAVRVSYPEQGNYNWHETLASYVEVGCVEVAFYRPELFLQRVTVEKVLAPFSTLPLRATSVHMAQARIADFDTFVVVLLKTIRIAQALGCPLIVAHPTNARLAEVESKIAGAVDPLLEQAGMILCWETFGGRRRFLSDIGRIAAFCQGRRGHAACYDTAHLHKPQPAVLADIAVYALHMGCFHLSNRSTHRGQQHLPLRHADGDLDFREIIGAIAVSGFAGPLTLEYLPQHHGALIEDALWVRSLLRR